MRVHDPVGTLVAVGFFALGVFLIQSTEAMTAMGSVFPIAISTAMMVFSTVLLVRNVVIGLRGEERALARSEETSAVGGSHVRRALFLVMMATWVVLLPVLGFFTASALGYFAVMAVATHERVSLLELLALVGVGLGILAGFTWLMANVLLIPLPRGLFF